MPRGGRLVYQICSAVKDLIVKIISTCAQDHTLGARTREEVAENL